MPCVLHFTGKSANVEELLCLSPIEPCNVYQKGVPKSNRPAARVSQTSGISLVVSEADFDYIEKQQEEALEFLKMHHVALSTMRHTQGVEHGDLDFGISMRNVIVQSDVFGYELLMEIASLNLDLVLSQYPPLYNKKSKKIKQYRRALRRNS